MRHLVFRDGESTLAPSRELWLEEGLCLEVLLTPMDKFTGMSVWSRDRASDSTGTIYERNTLNGKLRNFQVNRERLVFHLPMLRRMMVLDDLAGL